jgi:hypothetical protein
VRQSELSQQLVFAGVAKHSPPGFAVVAQQAAPAAPHPLDVAGFG